MIMAVQESARGEISKPNGEVIPGVAYLVYFKAAGKVEYEHPEFDAITGSASQGEEEPKIQKFVVTDLEPEERPLPDLDNLN